MDNISLGTFVSHRRKVLGMSQRELARQINVSNSTIARLEKNYNFAPDNSTLRSIANALGCDYNYLLALNKQIDDEPEIRMIQRAAKNMSPKNKKDMMAILMASFRREFEQAGNDEEI